MPTHNLKTLLDVPHDQRKPMSESESRTFLACTVMDAALADQPAAELLTEFADAPAAVRIMAYRLVAADPQTPVRAGTLLFLASISRNPGRCVLWAHYIATRTAALGRAVTVHDLADDFSMGFPTDQACSDIWDEQKAFRHGLKGDNLLDLREHWPVQAKEAA